jgi:hypothetical protein
MERDLVKVGAGAEGSADCGASLAGDRTSSRAADATRSARPHLSFAPRARATHSRAHDRQTLKMDRPCAKDATAVRSAVSVTDARAGAAPAQRARTEEALAAEGARRSPAGSLSTGGAGSPSIARGPSVGKSDMFTQSEPKRSAEGRSRGAPAAGGVRVRRGAARARRARSAPAPPTRSCEVKSCPSMCSVHVGRPSASILCRVSCSGPSTCQGRPPCERAGRTPRRSHSQHACTPEGRAGTVCPRCSDAVRHVVQLRQTAAAATTTTTTRR